jgi:choline-sulfatase
LLHGETHYDEVMQVPLIMFGAGVPRGVRIATPVSIVDIVPTVLGVLNEEPIEGIDGHDLRALWDAPQSEQARFFEQRAILSETGPEMEDNLRSVRKGRHKLIVNVASDEQELFDLMDDPGETRNIAPDHPELVAVLVKELESLTGRGLGTERAPPMSQELRDRLQALGYAVPDEG